MRTKILILAIAGVFLLSGSAMALTMGPNGWYLPTDEGGKGAQYELYTDNVLGSADAVANFLDGNDAGTGFWGYSGPAFFLWAEDELRTTWNLVWTGNGTGTPVYTFEGEIWVLPQPGGNTISGSTIAFESNDSFTTYSTTPATETNGDGTFENEVKISTLSYANYGLDGFSFQIEGDTMPSYLAFDLNITLNGIEQYADDGSYLIFIGQDMGQPISEDFMVAAPVPEPATILLLGAGLVGLGYFGRRKKLV